MFLKKKKDISLHQLLVVPFVVLYHEKLYVWLEVPPVLLVHSVTNLIVRTHMQRLHIMRDYFIAIQYPLGGITWFFLFIICLLFDLLFVFFLRKPTHILKRLILRLLFAIYENIISCQNHKYIPGIWLIFSRYLSASSVKLKLFKN